MSRAGAQGVVRAWLAGKNIDPDLWLKVLEYSDTLDRTVDWGRNFRIEICGLRFSNWVRRVGDPAKAGLFDASAARGLSAVSGSSAGSVSVVSAGSTVPSESLMTLLRARYRRSRRAGWFWVACSCRWLSSGK